MIRWSLLLFFAVTVFAFVGCDGAATDTERGVIRGQVFGQTETGRVPLSGAEIAAAALSVGVSPPPATTTEEDGSFELTDVAPGGYGLTVSREGYEAGYELARVDEGAVREVVVMLRASPPAP